MCVVEWNGAHSLSPAVPAPSVVIEEVGMPFNGSEYILSCNVTVDDSVNTDINISSLWYPQDMNVTSVTTEFLGNLEQQHNLTFQPLRSQDGGNYTCTTAISPAENQMFVISATGNVSETVVVKGE